ncbi:MAG: hypothetical protein ACP5M0_16155, partial [Desulfomonilaceae bacterium]
MKIGAMIITILIIMMIRWLLYRRAEDNEPFPSLHDPCCCAHENDKRPTLGFEEFTELLLAYAATKGPDYVISEKDW